MRERALIDINVPHPRHDNFIGDPTHVRIITPQMLTLFDKALNDEWKRIRAANTPFAHYLGVDFTIVSAQTIVGEPWRSQFSRGEVTSEQIGEALRRENNVAEEYRIVLMARK